MLSYMVHRDDREALRAKNEVLTRELREAKQELEASKKEVVRLSKALAMKNGDEAEYQPLLSKTTKIALALLLIALAGGVVLWEAMGLS